MNRATPITLRRDADSKAADQSSPEGGVSPLKYRRQGTTRLILLIVVPLAVLAAATVGWMFTGGSVSTDDSYVQANRIALAPRISGQVIEVDVDNNQMVKAGQLLLRIDPQPYQLALARKDAELAAARIDVEAMKAAYGQRVAELKAAQDSANYWTGEYERQHTLVTAQVASESKLEQVRTAMNNARFNVASLTQAAAAAAAALGGNPDLPTDQHPKVRAALAARDLARLDLDHTEIFAPGDAIVGNKSLMPGAWVQAGMPALDLISATDLWVDANFKETDLTDVRPGQPAAIEIDTYPGHEFKGHVLSLAPATGAEFALLPPQNSSGNWVKVVQRIPVRIAIDADPSAPPLRMGMSASIDITTGKTHGAALFPSLFGGKTAADSSRP
jgi:membrane fusion protein (multidrug efflux system)